MKRNVLKADDLMRLSISIALDCWNVRVSEYSNCESNTFLYTSRVYSVERIHKISKIPLSMRQVLKITKSMLPFSGGIVKAIPPIAIENTVTWSVRLSATFAHCAKVAGRDEMPFGSHAASSNTVLQKGLGLPEGRELEVKTANQNLHCSKDG